MEKAYILKGDPKEVDKVIRENRIRANRGVISFTPVEPDKADVSDKIAETTQEIAEAKEAAEKSTKAFAELAVQLVNIAVEHGAELPEDMRMQLAELGVSVPEDGETDNNSGENIPVNGNIDGDIIPKQPEDAVNENVTENPEQMDDKTPDVDDLKEVDLDDDKTPDVDDSKDVPAADVKEAEATAKTKRTKK